jgi:hypothetical protein
MVKNNKQEKKSNKNYKDNNGLSNFHLEIGLWISENRKRIKQGFLIFLIFFVASTLSYSTYHLTDYFLYGRYQDKLMLQDLTRIRSDSEYLRQVMAPDNLLFAFTNTYFVQGSYDFLTKIKNPNQNHYANFYYCFEESNRELACGESFILPGEDKYVMELNHKISGGVGAVNFVIKDISWRRITAHMIKDWYSYKNERLRFMVDMADFNIDNNNYSLEFTVNNNSSFSFKEVPLQIILLDSRGEIGVNKYKLRDLMSQQKVIVSMNWPVGPTRASQILIIPDVDILDNNNYIPYSGN